MSTNNETSMSEELKACKCDMRTKLLGDGCIACNTKFWLQILAYDPEATQRWKSGDEYLPYHPSASHVSPEHRDGWNAAYFAAPQPADTQAIIDRALEAASARCMALCATSMSPNAVHSAATAIRGMIGKPLPEIGSPRGVSDSTCVFTSRAAAMVEAADRLGLVVTVSQVPRAPLAMGNYDTVVSVRPARGGA
jgi:hypothetical protein